MRLYVSNKKRLITNPLKPIVRYRIINRTQYYFSFHETLHTNESSNSSKDRLIKIRSPQRVEDFY